MMRGKGRDERKRLEKDLDSYVGEGEGMTARLIC